MIPTTSRLTLFRIRRGNSTPVYKHRRNALTASTKYLRWALHSVHINVDEAADVSANFR